MCYLGLVAQSPDLKIEIRAHGGREHLTTSVREIREHRSLNFSYLLSQLLIQWRLRYLWYLKLLLGSTFFHKYPSFESDLTN